MKKVLLLIVLLVIIALPQFAKAGSVPFLFTAEVLQPSNNSTIKVGTKINLVVKVMPPSGGSGFKTSFIVTWPDGTTQTISSTGLDLNISKTVKGPVGSKAISVFAVMTQRGNTYVASQTLQVKVNITKDSSGNTPSVGFNMSETLNEVYRTFTPQNMMGAVYRIFK